MNIEEILSYRFDHYHTNICLSIATFMNLVFGVELVLHFIVAGPKQMWKEKRVLYLELILQLFAIWAVYEWLFGG
jgi:hypothetical protein